MNSPRPCCRPQPRAADRPRPPASRLARLGEVTGWIASSITLALLPKCPACLAAYVALATGIGISLPVATCLRMTLVVLCLTALVFMTLRRLRRFAAS